jgi:hypothetical protein
MKTPASRAKIAELVAMLGAPGNHRAESRAESAGMVPPR